MQSDLPIQSLHEDLDAGIWASVSIFYFNCRIIIIYLDKVVFHFKTMLSMVIDFSAIFFATTTLTQCFHLL